MIAHHCLPSLRNHIISAKLKKKNDKKSNRNIFIEVRIKGSKWLLCCSYNPNKLHISLHLQELSNEIDSYSNKYENKLLMGDLNIDVKGTNLLLFSNQYKLKSLNKHPTYSKNFNNPSGTDLLTTNSVKSFGSSCTATVLKEKYKSLPPKVMQHRAITILITLY